MSTASLSRETFSACHRLAEGKALDRLLAEYPLSAVAAAAAAERATGWITTIRGEKRRLGGAGDFMHEFGLSSDEGVALMCVAEALLRVPDSPTRDALIADKLSSVDWQQHTPKADTLFANASVWGLMLTGRVLNWRGENRNIVANLAGRLGAPVIRAAIGRAMAMLGNQFVLGRTIGEALTKGRELAKSGYTLSCDMLGEGARTQSDATRYFENYRQAIHAMQTPEKPADIGLAANISVKLSALHPRFQETQRDSCFPALVERLTTLCEAAAASNIGLTIDAEETERLELTLDIFTALLQSPVTDNWTGLGIAVQAYQKRAPLVIDELANAARQNGRRIMVRLVKGAYWDSEIKRSQMGGFADYPVYTRKSSTDVSYLVCARKMFDAGDVLYPAFGTHNAYTMAAIEAMAPPDAPFEFQRLQGMGEELHAQALKAGHRSRIYAPVGAHRDLLAYLVRRILENGANSSFVHRLNDPSVPVADLVRDPGAEVRALAVKRNPALPLPPDLFVTENRRNSGNVDLEAAAESVDFMCAVQGVAPSWQPAPLIDGQPQLECPSYLLTDPSDTGRTLGEGRDATPEMVDRALATADQAKASWAQTDVRQRADILDRASDIFEENRAELVARLVREAGRTVRNAVAEVREAVDLCRYYAACARTQLMPVDRIGYTGERNLSSFHPRGIIAAISPWNFPLAIFTGQIAAALVTGNAVMAKPAEQTPGIGHRAVQLLHAAGVPPAVLAYLPGSGETVGAQLVGDPRTSGVVFTGSTAVGRAINLAIANRAGPLIPLIAETGGLNAMIVDSTALPEQVADDVVTSAFDSAGQRCSSLRILFLQEEVADRMIEVITGLTRELKIGDPMDLSTDLGPVIDAGAKAGLAEHISAMQQAGKLLFAHPDIPAMGHFVAPHIFELPDMSLLKREAFGPILHIIRWKRDRLNEVVQAIKNSGYGLTGGIHSRRNDFVQALAAQLPIGNLYVNRTIIGAIPGVQPFGGEGLSGTGPKAGGPHYLFRFTTERHVSTDTTAAGGNASLLMQGSGT